MRITVRNLQPRKISGRSRLSTSREARLLHCLVQSNWLLSATQLRDQWGRHFVYEATEEWRTVAKEGERIFIDLIWPMVTTDYGLNRHTEQEPWHIILNRRIFQDYPGLHWAPIFWTHSAHGIAWTGNGGACYIQVRHDNTLINAPIIIRVCLFIFRIFLKKIEKTDRARKIQMGHGAVPPTKRRVYGQVDAQIDRLKLQL